MGAAQPRIGIYGVLEESEEGWENAGALLATVAKALSRAGMEPRVAERPVSSDATALAASQQLAAHDPDLLLAVVVCWSFDNLSLSILRRLPRPLAILAVPGIRSGSIVGAHQLGALLTDLGLPHLVCYGDPASEATYRPLIAYARAAAAKRRLELGRVGNLGRRTPGMTPASFDEVEVTRLFGAQVANYGWDEIEARAEAVSSTVVADTVRRIASVGAVRSSREALAEAARLFLALREQAQADGLLALAVGCYPQYAGRVCLPIGLLGEEGIPAGCEGDMNATLAMYLLQCFTDGPAHFGEILEVDKPANAIVTSHCGCAPPCLAANRGKVEVAPVRLWDRGACLRFPVATGPVTFTNLVGRRGTYRLCAVEGDAIPTEMVFEGNPGRLRLNLPVGALLDVIGEEGFGHHWVMGYGHVVPELRAFCKLSGVRGVFP